jgi:hypothetical protein
LIFILYLIILYLVSQDLFQKATELKLRLHMQSKNEKILITQHSFDQTDSIEKEHNPRKSMINLSSSTRALSIINLKEKPRIPIIRDKSVPNSTITRRTTMIGQSEINLDKTKLKSFDDKHRKTIKKHRNILNFNLIIKVLFLIGSLEASNDDVDSDGSELSSVSKISSTSMLSNHPERSRTIQKHRYLLLLLFKILIFCLVLIVLYIIMKFN